MDEKFPGAENLIRLLADRSQTLLAAGHIHTGFITHYQGVLCLTCPSVTMMMSPDYEPILGDTFYTEPAGFVVHDVKQGWIRSNICIVPDKENAGPYRFLE